MRIPGHGSRDPLLVLMVALTVTHVTVAAAADPASPQSTVGTADSLSIADCAALARRAAPDVAAGHADLDAARLDSLAARHNRRPTFAVTGGMMIAPDGFYDPAATNLGEYSLKAGIDLPLLDGGEAARARARASNAAKQASVELERAARDAGLRAAELAADLLRLEAKGRAQASTLDWLRGLADLIGSGVRAGSRDPADRLRVALEIDAVESAARSTRTDHDVAVRELAQLLGTPTDRLLSIRAPELSGDRAPTSDDSLTIAVRVAEMPEIRVERLNLAAQRIDLVETERRSALHLGLSADAGLWGTGLNNAVPPDLRAENPDATLGDRLKRDLGASVSLGFRLPFADATLRPAREARVAAVRAASLRVQQTETTQARIVGDLIARWQSAAVRLFATREIASQAEEHLLRMKSLYAAGSVSILELLDARRLVDDARDRLADARAELWTARSEAEMIQ